MYRSRATFKTVPSTTLISTVHIFFSSLFTSPQKKSCDMDVNIPIILMRKPRIWELKQAGWGHNTSKQQVRQTRADSLVCLTWTGRTHASPHSLGERGCDCSYMRGLAPWLGTFMLVDIFSSTGDGRMSVSGREKCLNASFPEHRGCYLISFLPKPAEECYKSLWLKTP